MCYAVVKGGRGFQCFPHSHFSFITNVTVQVGTNRKKSICGKKGAKGEVGKCKDAGEMQVLGNKQQRG